MKLECFSQTLLLAEMNSIISRGKAECYKNASLFQNPYGGNLLLLDSKRSEPKYEFVVLP